MSTTADSNVVKIVLKGDNQLGPAFAEAKGEAGELAAATEELAAAQQEEALAGEELAARQAALEEVQAREGATTEEVTAAQVEYAAALERTQVAAESTAAAQEKVTAAQAETTAATEASGDAAEEAGAKADASGGLFAGAGGKIKMAALGAAIGIGLAVKSGMDFQQLSTKWVTSAGESAKNLGMVQRGVLSLSAQTATSSTELANGMYMVESAGFHGAAGLTVLKAAAQGAKAEGADLGEVANAVTSGLNAYGMSAKQATSFTNMMVATVGQGKMTMQDLASSLSAVLPIAAANKISYQQVGGALATMTSMGVSARQGTQDLASTIRSLANPNSVATAEMQQLGLSSTSLSKNLGKAGLTGTIAQLSDAVTSHMGPSGMVIQNALNQSKAAAADANQMLGMLPKNIRGVAQAYLDGKTSYTTFNNDTKTLGLSARTLADQFASTAGKAHGFNSLLTSGSPAAQTYAAAMSKMLGGATGLNVALMLTGTHAATFNNNVKAIGDSAKGAGQNVNGWNDITHETSFQMAQAGDSIKAAGTSLGLALLPAVSAILGPLAHLLSLIAGNKAASIALAVVVGGILAGAVGTKAVHALTDMRKAMKEVADGTEALVKKILGLGKAQETTAAASSKAATEEATAAEGAATAEEEAAGEAAAANEEAAATSSGSWITAAASQVAAAAGWVAGQTAKIAAVVGENVAGAASAAGAWIAGQASQLASGAVTVAGMIAKVAVMVAANVAGALSTAAAWAVANGVMLLGIGLIIAAVVAAVILIVKHWKQISDAAKEAFDDVLHAVEKAIDWVKSHWPLVLAILTGPIGIAVLLITRYWSDIVHGAESAFDAVTHAVSTAIDWVRGHWPLLLAILTGPIGLAVLFIVDHWHQIISGAQDMGSRLISFFRGLPGRIMSAVGDLGSLLFGAGERVINGLINGIKSAIGGISSVMGDVTSEIKSFLPFSPAKKGPLSGSGAPENSGKSIVRLVAQGITGNLTTASGAARQLAERLGMTPGGGIGSTGPAGVASALSGMEVTLVVQRTGDPLLDQIFQGMRLKVREKGGGGPNSVQRALGRTWPAGA